MRNKIIVLLGVIILLIFSQWLTVKFLYAHKLGAGKTEFFAKVYNLKMGVIEEDSDNINIYLKDFFKNKDFADKLIQAQTTLKDQNITEEEIADLVWNKLLKHAWLSKVADENNIEINNEDIAYYINAVGGQENLEKNIASQGVSIDEYKEFLIRPDILAAKVYDHLIASFKDERGVLKIQEAYALLEAEEGENWDEVVEEYSEDMNLSKNSFWLAEEELINMYEPIIEIEVGEFSKIIQVPVGYVIWHLDSILEDDEQVMREVRGIFVHSKSIDNFFDDYLETVNVNRKY
ncbi:MAG: hypothetical protein HOE19_03730 [Candidatus Komeilibacteria bacterium]|jgi:hypothetical protein|nr:hypothetical protein [Candidatus Komeilibacteria bacterium]MBT4447787.1 hypothetical protein [Candidatus Komeilibacteria bacterium]